MNKKSSTIKFVGAWLFLLRMAAFMAGLGLALEGGMMLLKLIPVPKKVPLPVVSLWNHWTYPYSKKLIVCGISVLVCSLLVGIAHERVKEDGEVGPIGLSIGLLSTAWTAVCLWTLQRLVLG